jgi:hypothetical protein
MFSFEHPEVEILIDGMKWQRVASLLQVGADDLAYELNPQTGRLIFGNGEHGRRPPAGSSIQLTYRHGIGKAGEVASASWNWVIPEQQQVVLLGVAAQAGAIQIRHLQSKLDWQRRLAFWLCAWLWGR